MCTCIYVLDDREEEIKRKRNEPISRKHWLIPFPPFSRPKLCIQTRIRLGYNVAGKTDASVRIKMDNYLLCKTIDTSDRYVHEKARFIFETAGTAMKLVSLCSANGCIFCMNYVVDRTILRQVRNTSPFRKWRLSSRRCQMDLIFSLEIFTKRLDSTFQTPEESYNRNDKSLRWSWKSRERGRKSREGREYLLPLYRITAAQFLEHCLIQSSIIPPSVVHIFGD